MTYLIVVLIIISGIYYNTFKWLLESWTNNPYYSHGFLVPIISIYIIWRMRKDLLNIERKSSQKGLLILLLGLIFQLIGTMYIIRFLSGLSLIMTIFGILLYIYGWEFTNKVRFPISFLLLAIPLPIVDIIAPPIQNVSAVISSNLINLVGIPVQRDGLILNSPSGSFEVALECSGLMSVISLLTLSIIYTYMLDINLLKRSVLILSSIPLAISVNILRITSIISVSNEFGQETALNYFHDFSNILVFGIATVGLLLEGRILESETKNKIEKIEIDNIDQ